MQVSQPIAPHQLFGKVSRCGNGDGKAIPAAHASVACHQPLAQRKRLAVIGVDHPDLRQPRAKGVGGVDMVGQPHCTLRSGRIIDVCAAPIARRAVVQRSGQIIAQSGGQRGFIAR